LLLLSLTALGNADGKKEAIPIAAIFGLTGRAATSNTRHLKGAQLAVEEVNAKGGVLGHPLDLITLDNESTAVGSAEAAKKAAAKNVAAIVGASWSDHSLAIAPIAQSAGIPMISNYSTNPKVTRVGNYIFRTCYVDTFQAGIMARFARQRLKLNRVAILFESGSEYSVGLSVYFRKEFDRLGGIVIAAVPYLKDSLDFSDQLRQIQEARPQAIYLPAYPKEAGMVMRQASKIGVRVPFLGSDSWGDTMVQFLGGPVRDGYEVKPWSPKSPNPLNRQFVLAYRKKFGEDHEDLSGSALAYDAVMLLVDAIRRAGTPERAKIREALEKTTGFQGVTGPIRFDPERNPIKGAVINRYKNSTTSSYFTTVEP